MTKMKRIIALTLTLALLVTMFVGCGQSKNTPGEQEAAVPPVQTPAEEAKAPQQEPTEVTVTDMADRTITIPKEIKSIATFGSIGVINAFVELMGSGDKISNQMTSNFTKSDKWKMQYEFAPQIKDAPLLQNADGELISEEIIRLNPDLCIVMSKDLIEPLEKLGMNVLYFEWQQTDDVKTAVSLMGEALGQQELAADYLKYFDDMVIKAQELTKALNEDQKKTVLYGNITKYTQPHLIAEWWVQAAGGKSVTDNGRDSNKSFEYTAEDLLLWNPEVMIVTELAMIDEIKGNNVIAGVKAVKDGQIYYVPTVAHVWGNRTVEQPLTVFWTMHKLYPELVSRDELAEEIKYFYSHFFKYEMSNEQIDAIIDSN